MVQKIKRNSPIKLVRDVSAAPEEYVASEQLNTHIVLMFQFAMLGLDVSPLMQNTTYSVKDGEIVLGEACRQDLRRLAEQFDRKAADRMRELVRENGMDVDDELENLEQIREPEFFDQLYASDSDETKE